MNPRNASADGERFHTHLPRGPEPSGPEAAPKSTELSFLSALAPGGRLIAWGALVMFFSLGLVERTDLWWLIFVFGLAVPLVSAAQTLAIARATSRRDVAASWDRGEAERQLLDVLAKGGEFSPASAAIRTRLTVEETARTLEALDREGRLRARTRDGGTVYALPNGDRHDTARAQQTSDSGPRNRSEDRGSAREVFSSAAPPKSTANDPEQEGDPAEVPGWPASDGSTTEPLSDRELEVLDLLATGLTNSEIARDLFVARGTVKAHVGNIYRKLGAHNRTEALAKARRLGLLR